MSFISIMLMSHTPKLKHHALAIGMRKGMKFRATEQEIQEHSGVEIAICKGMDYLKKMKVGALHDVKPYQSLVGTNELFEQSRTLSPFEGTRMMFMELQPARAKSKRGKQSLSEENEEGTTRNALKQLLQRRNKSVQVQKRREMQKKNKYNSLHTILNCYSAHQGTDKGGQTSQSCRPNTRV